MQIECECLDEDLPSTSQYPTPHDWDKVEVSDLDEAVGHLRMWIKVECPGSKVVTSTTVVRRCERWEKKTWENKKTSHGLLLKVNKAYYKRYKKDGIERVSDVLR